MTASVSPLPGAGLAVRYGDLVLVCADRGSAVDSLVALVAEVAAAGGDGSALVRRLAALAATDDGGQVPACAAGGITADGRLAVLAYGEARVRLTGVDGPLELSGADAIGAVSRLVSGQVGDVRLELPGAGEPNPRASLESGVVPAGGAVVRYGPAAPSAAAPIPPIPATVPPPLPPPVVPYVSARLIPEPAPAPPVSAPPYSAPPFSAPPFSAPPFSAPPFSAPPFSAPSIVEVPAFVEAPPFVEAPVPVAVPELDAAASGLPTRQPREASPAVPTMAELDGPRVRGVTCLNGHLNDPRQMLCVVCGVSMDQQTMVMREAPRPSLGTLQFDDGTSTELELDLVIGREPQFDPDVVNGSAKPVLLTDTEGVISRRHLRIVLAGWDVQVVDLGSANGTFVSLAGQPERQQAVANHPVTLTPGGVVAVGRRWFRYDPHRSA